jgi:hypothetical protein
MIHVSEEGIIKLITVIKVRKVIEYSDILRYTGNFERYFSLPQGREFE